MAASRCGAAFTYSHEPRAPPQEGRAGGRRRGGGAAANPVVSWSRAAFASASILVVLLYVVLAVLRTMLTKALFNINFNPVAFSAATAFCTCVALVPVFVFDRRQWAVPKREYLPQFLVVCALCAVNLAGTNTAVAHLSLTLQQCLVATIPAFTVVVESGYKRTLAHPAIYATILALCAGPIVMATGYSGVISPLGVVAQMLAVAASACKSVILHALLDKARRLHRRAARARAPPPVLPSLRSPPVPQPPLAGEEGPRRLRRPLLDRRRHPPHPHPVGPRQRRRLVALVRSPKNPYQWAQLVGTAVLGGARFFSQLLVLKFHPASSLAVANLGMQALNMYLAIWLFGTPALTPHVVGGSVLALAMAALYSYFKWSRVLERGACFAVHEDFRKCCALPCLRRTEDFRGRLPPGIVE